jgi:hypothetical protein
MTAQGRKLHFIDFFKQCCLNATRGRDRVVVDDPLSFGTQIGSDAFSFCAGQSSLKKIDFPATVHLTSDELEARDLTFSLTVGPGQSDCCSNRRFAGCSQNVSNGSN